MYFRDGEILENYVLDKPSFYFDFVINGGNQKHVQHHEITFCKTGKSWKATYNFETIFDYFGLNGEDDYAPFIGFYKVL